MLTCIVCECAEKFQETLSGSLEPDYYLSRCECFIDVEEKLQSLKGPRACSQLCGNSVIGPQLRDFSGDLHVLCRRMLCVDNAFGKRLQEGEDEGETPSEGPCSRVIDRCLPEYSPRNAGIGSISTVKIFALLSMLYSIYWDYFTCVMTIHAEMPKSGDKEMEIPV